MRTLLLAAALLSVPSTEAQVRLGATAGAGYHHGFDAPLVGAAGEVTWMPEGSGVRIGARLFADYVLMEQTSFPGRDVGGDVFGRQSSAARWGTAVVAYWEGIPLPVTPYVKGGLAWEETWEHFPGANAFPTPGPYTISTSGLTAFSGYGLSRGVVYVEASYGIAVRSYARNNVGGGRIAVGVTF